MALAPVRYVSRFSNVLKTCSRAYRTAREVREVVGGEEKKIRAILGEFEEHGILSGRRREGHFRGTPPREFAVSREWGGSV